MPTKIHDTGITFPDLTTQTTAAGSTTQYSIGSYIIGRPYDYTSYNNSTIAGSSLYATSPMTFVAQGVQAEGGAYGPILRTAQPIGTPNSLVNTGSWRCVSIAGQGYSSQYGYYDYNGHPGLWVRYA
jgi:hypothetical protein